MNDKSAWPGFGNLLGGLKGGKPASKGLTTVEQRCAAGLHAIDPSWTHCSYCEAIAKAGERSNRGVPPSPPPAAPPVAATGRRPTLVDDDDGPAVPPAGPGYGSGGGASPQRGRTMVDTSSTEGPAPGHQARSGLRLTGVLSTFTWSRLGQLFEIHEGRNYVGSGTVASANNSPCDVLVTDDGTLSGAHFLILCQGPRTIISDNLSTNGTFVNGEQIDTRGMELPDDAVIKAGATVFRFQKIHLVTGGEPTRGHHAGEPEPSSPRFRDDTLS